MPDVEHAIKTRFLKDIEDNSEEDGYDIIRRFIAKYERSCQNIQKHKSSEYCRELIEKYYPYFPVVFVELISFEIWLNYMNIILRDTRGV